MPSAGIRARFLILSKCSFPRQNKKIPGRQPRSNRKIAARFMEGGSGDERNGQFLTAEIAAGNREGIVTEERPNLKEEQA